MVCENKLPELVVTCHSVLARPEQKADARRSDLLLRQKVQLHLFHTRTQGYGIFILQVKVGVPFARPADGDHHASLIRHLKIKKWESGVV